MKRACLALVLLLAVEAAAAQKPCPQPLWTVDLVAKYGFRLFDPFRGGWGRLPESWKMQRGVVFISPEMLAVYQIVISNQLVPRGQRDENSGAGKYIFQVVFLDTKQEEEVRTLRLITGGSDFSGVYPTYDGRFLVKTEGMLRLYSPAFEEIASRPLPLSETATSQGWVVSVSPSGELVRATHATDNLSEGTYEEKRYLFDADSLETLRVRIRGRSDAPDGGWDVSNPFFKDISCPRNFGRIPGQLFLGLDCKKKLKLFSPDGNLFWDVPIRRKARSLLHNGKLLAVELHRHRSDPFDLGIQSKPLRIALYDLATKSEKCSIRISEVVSDGWGRSMFYALSPAGTVAVIQGKVLSLYRP